MELKGRQQANRPSGDPLLSHDQAEMSAELGAGDRVDSPANSSELPGGDQT
jgi:hypothetical protein